MLQARARNLPILARNTAIIVLATLLFFAGFITNFWRAADEQWFQTRLRHSDSYVLGRMVQARQQGILSDGGLLGRGRPGLATMPDRELFDYQFAAYETGHPFGVYEAYKSQLGLQGILFSMADARLPFPPATRLLIFDGMTALLTALAFALLVLWFYGEFGGFVAVFSLASMLLSPWLTLFGRSLFWSFWAFYVPMLAGICFLRRQPVFTRRTALAYAAIVFATVVLKCLFNGYEFITTTLVMMVVPLAYYALLRRWGLRRFLAGLAVATCAACLAVLSTFVILSIQVAAVDGSVAAGIHHILFSFEKRSWADPSAFPEDLSFGLEASLAWVLTGYLGGTFVDLSYWITAPSPFIAERLFQIKYWYLLVFLLAASVVLLAASRRRTAAAQPSRATALAGAAWFSLLAPLSWYVIFKAHAAMHGHIDYIVWQMPFTTFAVGASALALRSVLAGIGRRLGLGRTIEAPRSG